MKDDEDLLRSGDDETTQILTDLAEFIDNTDSDVASLRAAYDLLAIGAGDWIDVEEVSDSLELPAGDLDILDVEVIEEE